MISTLRQIDRYEIQREHEVEQAPPGLDPSRPPDLGVGSETVLAPAPPRTSGVSAATSELDEAAHRRAVRISVLIARAREAFAAADYDGGMAACVTAASLNDTRCYMPDLFYRLRAAVSRFVAG